MTSRVRGIARHVRQLGMGVVRALGGFRLMADSEWRRRRLLILCYHGVSLHDEHEWNGRLFVSPAFLRRRFEILRDGGYRVLPLGEAIRGLRGGSLPPRSVALTFDDGLYDFLAAAVPLLEEFGYPATNYVSTYYCVNQDPVPIVALRYILWRAGSRMLEPGTLPGQDVAVDLGDSVQRERLAAKLVNAMHGRADAAQAKRALLDEVARRLAVPMVPLLSKRLFHLLSPAEVADVARRGFDIQLHTHRHRTPRDKPAFCSEVIENRNLLESMTGRPAVHFCYPSGDVDPAFLPWLRELGVETATTTATTDLATAGRDLLLLPRVVDTMEIPEIAFASWLSGVGAVSRLRSSQARELGD